MVDIPIPPIQKGQVRVKIKAVSFNPVDYQVRKGLSESKMVTSNILGRDFSGIVDEVHEDVSDFKKGDEVYGYVCNLASSGTYTEYVSLPQEILAKKPLGLTNEQAAAIPVAGITASIVLDKTRTTKSGSMFIAGGAGGVGTFTILFAKKMGVENIITTAGNDRSLDYLINYLQLKKDQIINYKQSDFVQHAIKRNEGYFDIAIDLVGGKMLAACCELLGLDGNLASVVDPPDRDSFEILFQKNASFHSVGANAYSLSNNRKQWKIYRQILDRISKFYDDREMIKPSITILGKLSVDVVRQAHELLEKSFVQGKLIMTV